MTLLRNYTLDRYAMTRHNSYSATLPASGVVVQSHRLLRDLAEAPVEVSFRRYVLHGVELPWPTVYTHTEADQVLVVAYTSDPDHVQRQLTRLLIAGWQWTTDYDASSRSYRVVGRLSLVRGGQA